ncbi:hypothetical protein HZH68_002381 [Vespula germanica]|uniref:Uncharacterized protein n=1 Tax=Vespula germanica TaxID=30212 RepID=A0A834U0H9_VESGE|nr:hypothetical protein HZH68_002381 [Vespula germanica]
MTFSDILTDLRNLRDTAGEIFADPFRKIKFRRMKFFKKSSKDGFGVGSSVRAIKESFLTSKKKSTRSSLEVALASTILGHRRVPVAFLLENEDGSGFSPKPPSSRYYKINLQLLPPPQRTPLHAARFSRGGKGGEEEEEEEGGGGGGGGGGVGGEEEMRGRSKIAKARYPCPLESRECELRNRMNFKSGVLVIHR